MSPVHKTSLREEEGELVAEHSGLELAKVDFAVVVRVNRANRGNDEVLQLGLIHLAALGAKRSAEDVVDLIRRQLPVTVEIVGIKHELRKIS